MRVRFWINVSMIVAALCVTGLLAAAQQQGSSDQQTGDPVADAARKAREKKKDAPKPKKIYTDDDVKKSAPEPAPARDRKSTRLNSSHRCISYAVFCLKKKKKQTKRE